MVADYGRFRLGKVEYPLAAPASGTETATFDPALEEMRLFFVAMIQKHLGLAFDAIATDVGLTALAGNIVRESVTFDPTPFFKDFHAKLPLFALWRVEEDPAQHTVAWFKTGTIITAVYMLPPMSAAQASRLVHVLRGVRAVITNYTAQGYDPDYDNGREVWGDSGLMSLTLTKIRYGYPQFQGFDTNTPFPTVEFTFALEEREENNPGLLALEGLDASIENANGNPPEDVPIAEISWENVTP